jgi:hypothetical protein
MVYAHAVLVLDVLMVGGNIQVGCWPVHFAHRMSV